MRDVHCVMFDSIGFSQFSLSGRWCSAVHIFIVAATVTYIKWWCAGWPTGLPNIALNGTIYHERHVSVECIMHKNKNEPELSVVTQKPLPKLFDPDMSALTLCHGTSMGLGGVPLFGALLSDRSWTEYLALVIIQPKMFLKIKELTSILKTLSFSAKQSSDSFEQKVGPLAD